MFREIPGVQACSYNFLIRIQNIFMDVVGALELGDQGQRMAFLRRGVGGKELRAAKFHLQG